MSSQITINRFPPKEIIKIFLTDSDHKNSELINRMKTGVAFFFENQHVKGFADIHSALEFITYPYLEISRFSEKEKESFCNDLEQSLNTCLLAQRLLSF